MNQSGTSLGGLPTPYLWPLDDAGFILPDRLVAVGRYRSAPIQRAARTAKRTNHLVDLTYGKACQWVLFMDSGHVVLCSAPMPVAMIDDPGFIDYLINSHGEV
jgi:regulator of extracellular matrix RemA (YlzA/DUF370 family)